jgi:glycerophosphoryl diester phosphodiesterase
VGIRALLRMAALGLAAFGLAAFGLAVAAPDPAGAGSKWTGTTADCALIPAVHHRMWGISGERHGDGTENTIYGMQKTYEKGIRWFETDAQALLSQEEKRARDNGTYAGGHHGKIVLFHDSTLDRTTRATGRIRDRAYGELPLTNDGHRIPTLAEAIRWIKNHPGTHLLVEIKMKLPWRRVNDTLVQYGFNGTDRILFDTNKLNGEKRRIGLQAAEKLKAITGAKNWPIDRSATWLRQFGTSVRLIYPQAVAGLDELKAAGIAHRFSKIANGNSTWGVEAQWTGMVTSGAFRYIITERSGRYLSWCAEQQDIDPPDPTPTPPPTPTPTLAPPP